MHFTVNRQEEGIYFWESRESLERLDNIKMWIILGLGKCEGL